MVKKFSDFNKGKDLQIADITPALLQRYDYYLQTVLKNSANTRHRDFKYLKMVFKEAYKLDYIDSLSNPFDKYTIKTSATSKQYLTEDEIERISDLDLTQNLNHEISKNIFLFACYAYGLRISDIILLRKNQLVGDRIKIKTKKTNHQLDVKLPQKAIEILDWFNKINPDNDFIFGLAPKDLDINNPVAVDSLISTETARYNKFLKIIARKANIEKPLSSHIARHSFGTRALRKGLDIYQVSTLMTHSSLKQTQAYAKIVSSELDKVADKL
jgi:site-specific recombinase XerD